MNKKKYKLTKETVTNDNTTLFRIKARRSFNDVKKGDLGGYIESEDNLSHEAYARVCGDAKVFGNARVYRDAKVCGDAWVYDIDIAQTGNCINIIGFSYPITITYSYVRIGCRHISLDELDLIKYEDVKKELCEEEFHRLKSLINISLDQILEGVCS